MSELLHVQKIFVPMSCIQVAHAHLYDMGQLGWEGFALWAGDTDGNNFLVHEVIIPAQQAHQLASGVCVTVNGEELHRINVWLYEHHMTLVAQLHSHPTEAYHSETDDTYPIATLAGSLSIVVPDFAQADLALASCAIYRLLPPHGWVCLSASEAEDIIVLMD